MMSPSSTVPSHRGSRALVLSSVILLALGFASALPAQQPRVLKISHQFPASAGGEGDFRNDLPRRAGAAIEQHQAPDVAVEPHDALLAPG